MRARYVMLAVIFSFSVAQPLDAQSVDRKAEFERSFLSNNYAGFRFHQAQPVKAGSLLTSQSFILIDSLEECIAEEWSERYQRSDISYQIAFRNSQRSGNIGGEVKARFNLNGTLRVSVSEKLAEAEAFDLEADNVRIEQRRVRSIISPDESCKIYVDAYLNRYLPPGNLLIGRAFFFAGRVSHSYGLELSGEGSGSINIGQIGDFLESIPFLSGISDFFRFEANLEVGGQAIDSDVTNLDFGDSTIFATGFLPTFLQSGNARDIVSSINQLQEGVATLLKAAETPESASKFLSDHPEFDFSNAESLVARAFSGEGLILYGDFLKENPEGATEFSAIFSQLIEVNRIAGRFEPI